jgi:hypothetical protein
MTSYKELIIKQYTDDPNWIYAGSEPIVKPDGTINMRDYEYFQDLMDKYKCVFPDGRDRPKKRLKCKCQTPIRWNHYIFHTKRKKVTVIGSECINKFSNKIRHCLECGEKTKNWKDWTCNDCRAKHKAIEKKKKQTTCACGKRKQEGYRKCYSCHSSNNSWYCH